MIKHLYCKIGGCNCHSLEDFDLEIDTVNRMFTLPEFYCTVCMGKLNVVVISEELIVNPTEIPNAG
jgi:hypothetical protein